LATFYHKKGEGMMNYQRLIKEQPVIFNLSVLFILLLLCIIVSCKNTKETEAPSAEEILISTVENSQQPELFGTGPLKRISDSTVRNLGSFSHGGLLDVNLLPVLSIRPFGLEYEIQPSGNQEPAMWIDNYIETSLVIENITPAAWPIQLTIKAPDKKVWQEKLSYDIEANSILNVKGLWVGNKNENVPNDLYIINLNFNESFQEGIWTFGAAFKDAKLKPLTMEYIHQPGYVCVQNKTELSPLGEERNAIFTIGTKIYLFGAGATPASEIILAFYRDAKPGEVEGSDFNPQVAECATKIKTDSKGHFQTIFTIGPEIEKGSYTVARGADFDKLELVYFSGHFEIE
jgi:hypothetical protein